MNLEVSNRLVKCYVWRVTCYIHVKQGPWEGEMKDMNNEEREREKEEKR